MNNQVGNIQEALSIALTSVVTNVINFIPNIVAAIIVIVSGVLIARWTKWVTVKLFEAVRLSSALKDSPIEKFLEKAEITSKIEEVFGNLIKSLVLLVFFIAAINLLGLTTVSTFLNNILGYIPRIFAAALIILVGTIVAGLVESLIKGSFAQINKSTARLISKVGSYIVMTFAVLAAIAQLGIAENLINALFFGFIATLSIGFGLAFGLGAKELVARILNEWYSSLKKELK